MRKGINCVGPIASQYAPCYICGEKYTTFGDYQFMDLSNKYASMNLCTPCYNWKWEMQDKTVNENRRAGDV
jgi:hypothetical protein